jgi:hypothetical protein
MQNFKRCITFQDIAFFDQAEHLSKMSTLTHSGILSKRGAPASRVARKKDKPRRTTVSLSADSAAIVERFKSASGLSTSRAIEELILRSEPREPRIKMVNGLAVFDVELENGPITTEEIRKLEDLPW